MDTNIIIVLTILVLTMMFLILDVVRIDVVAIGCMLSLGWAGILNPQEMFSGFSSNAVIAMMGVMILGRGIARTGIMSDFSSFVIQKAGTRRRNLVGWLSLSAGLLSGLIQNIGSAALFLPGIMQVSRRTKIPASALIMPVGFAAILGGTLTMVGSGPLILVNDLLRTDGFEAYNLFSVTPIGIVLLLSGIGYFLLFGRMVLPKATDLETGDSEEEAARAKSSNVKPQNRSILWPAIACFVSAIALAVIGFPISMAFLTGALGMVLTRVLSIADAYEAIEWKVVFMLAGLIPLGVAMQKTGTANFLAESIMSVVVDLHPVFFVMMIGVLSTAFSLFMSNVGAIVVLAPLVIGMATIANMDPRPLVLMAAVCAANSFVLPTHQVNAFLMSSGGYRNFDYIKAGSGMTILFLVVTVTLFYVFMI